MLFILFIYLLTYLFILEECAVKAVVLEEMGEKTVVNPIWKLFWSIFFTAWHQK